MNAAERAAEVEEDYPKSPECCPACKQLTLVETETWPETLTDPACSTGYCTNGDCDYQWD